MARIDPIRLDSMPIREIREDVDHLDLVAELQEKRALLTSLDQRLEAAARRTGASPAQLQEIRAQCARREADQLARQEAFEQLRATVKKWWPAFMPLLTAQLGAIATLIFMGIQHSIALFTMGESGSGKSMEIKVFLGLEHHPQILRVDKFTVASLLSGYGDSKKEDLEQNALFRRVKQNVLVTPELARIFRGRANGVLDERFGELAAWLDGEGIISVTGTHGFQGAEGDYTCVWLGCTTPFHLQAWITMERLGQRLLFFPAPNVSTEAEVPEEQIDVAKAELQSSTKNVLDILFKQHKTRSLKPWPVRGEAVDLEINRLTELLAEGHVAGGGDLSLEQVTRPDVKHFRSRIREIVSGAVWVTGRESADETDIQEIVRPIIQRSMPQARGPVLLALYDGLQTVKEISKLSGLSASSVERTLQDLQRKEIVRMEPSSIREGVGAPGGRWFLVRLEARKGF